MTNPLLAKVKMPGRSFQLPSKGLFYDNGELSPDVVNGEVHVRPMSALHEITMKNPDMLFSGKAIETVFTECVDGVEKPSLLFSKDVDAIMLFLRAVTYGGDYEFTARHIDSAGNPVCPDAKTHSYVDNLEPHIFACKFVDPTTAVENFKVELSNGQIVSMYPNRYNQVVDLVKNSNMINNKSTPEEQVDHLKRTLIGILMSVIKSVEDTINGERAVITNRDFILEWLVALPAPMTNKLASKIDELNDWGISTVATVECKDCGAPFEVELPINPVNFFTE